MIHNLYFVQNMLTFSGLSLIQLPKPNDLICINPYYVRDETKRINLITDIQKLFPYLNCVDFSEIDQLEYDTVFLTTLCDESYPVISSLNTRNYIFIEDGSGDYISHNVKNPYYSYRVWLFQPSLVQHDEIKESAAISLDGALCIANQLYKNELAVLSDMDINTPCLFTTPLEEDFNCSQDIVDKILDYIHDTLNITDLIISTHPRDRFTYRHKNMNILTIPSNMPGQTINRMFRGKKLYLFPSTVVMSSRIDDNITLLNPLPNDKKYNDSALSVLNSPIFTGRPYEILSF